jgi:hypothetical protein
MPAAPQRRRVSAPASSPAPSRPTNRRHKRCAGRPCRSSTLTARCLARRTPMKPAALRSARCLRAATI